MAVATIVDFSNFKFLTVWRLKRAELHRRAIFGRNRSKRSRDTAIFRFFKMAAIRHLGFVACVLGPPTKGIWWSLSLCTNFVGIDGVVLIICMSFDFTSLAWKRLFTTPKLGFWCGILPPKWGAMSTKPKRHIPARVRVVGAIMRENPSTRLTYL